MKIKISKNQWQSLGKKAGWIKTSQDITNKRFVIRDVDWDYTTPFDEKIVRLDAREIVGKRWYYPDFNIIDNSPRAQEYMTNVFAVNATVIFKASIRDLGKEEGLEETFDYEITIPNLNREDLGEDGYRWFDNKNEDLEHLVFEDNELKSIHELITKYVENSAKKNDIEKELMDVLRERLD
jgi:hypothetical protein